MANVNTICVSALAEMMNGTHALGTSPVRGGAAKDVLKAALYLATATMDKTATVYTTTGEVSSSGTNYTAGGITITNATAPTFSNDTAYWTPSASFVYTTVTLTSAFDAVLIYNFTQGGASGKAISVHTFGSQTVTAGTFTLTMPVNAESTGLIRFTRV